MKKLSLLLLSKQILSLRKEQSIAQKQLSELTGIHRAMLVRLEAENYIPFIPQLEKLGDVLGFGPTDFFISDKPSSSLEKCSPLNIAVARTGYVGLSIATLLAQHNHVTAVDIIPEKVELIIENLLFRMNT